MYVSLMKQTCKLQLIFAYIIYAISSFVVLEYSILYVTKYNLNIPKVVIIWAYADFLIFNVACFEWFGIKVSDITSIYKTHKI